MFYGVDFPRADPTVDLMMAVVFIAIEGLRHAGVGDLKEPIESDEANAFKDWWVPTPLRVEPPSTL